MPLQIPVTSTQITDSTSTGRGVLTAADAATARGLIGAGTGSASTKADVGLSNVDNTADSAKPVSAAQQLAINAAAYIGVSPFWHGYKGWNFPPEQQAADQTPLTGVMYLSMIYLPAGAVITNLYVRVTTAMTGPTANANYAGLYDFAGNRVGVTADQGTNWATAGIRQMALTSTYTVTASGFFLVALLANASGVTNLFRRAASSGDFNANINAPFRQSSFGSSLTALPSSFTPGSTASTNTAPWIAVN